MIRESIKKVGQLGPLPDANDEISDGILEKYEELFKSIDSALNLAEATVVAGLFPAAACFGMEWTVLHLLEGSEGWPSSAIDAVSSQHWKDELRERLHRKNSRTAS